MSGTTLLDQSHIFDQLEVEQRKMLSQFFVRFQSSPGSTIFGQNTPADYFYVLLSGEVLIRFKPYDDEEITVSRIQPGGVFGWSAALGNPEYTASAVSMDNCQMLRMRGEDLQNLCQSDPKFGAKVLENLARAAGQHYNNAQNQVIALLEYGLCNSDSNRRNAYGDSSG